MAIIDLNPPAVPPLPTGSLIRSDSKFGHELVAGPIVGGRQLVAHSEPDMGVHVEFLDNAAQRYAFSEILAPQSDYHGVAAWNCIARKEGSPWAFTENCQHQARAAYFGVPESPTLNGFVVFGAAALLIYAASRD